MIKSNNILKVVAAFVVVLLIVSLSGLLNVSIDLTEDKRYTLSPVTVDFLGEQIDEDLHIDLYLDGAVNSGFRRLEKSTLTMLKQFQSVNKKQVSFSHIELDDITDAVQKKALLEQMNALRLEPMNVIDEDANGKRVQKAIYPWAVVSYKGKKQAVKLLVNVNAKTGQENLNSSIESLEYRFTEAFRLLTETADKRIAFLEGHGELGEGETYDITTALSHYCSVDRGQIGSDASILNAYEVLIIAKPTQPFSESEKYVLDQYIMNGGKVLWLVDGVKMSMDSLTRAETNYGIYNDVNISDMLFRYGVRINPELIQDMQCALYPVNIAGPNEAARFQPLPWFYSPLLMPNPAHSLSKNISNVKAEFVSSLSLVDGVENIDKTILLSTSSQSKVMPVPMAIDLGMSVDNLDINEFTAGQLPVGVLLEGEFNSVFSSRAIPRDLKNAGATKKVSKRTKMIVIADGDMIANDLRGSGAEVQVVPLGYDYATNQAMFGNRDFLINAVNYLMDDEGWYTLRQRTLKLRLLDQEQMERRQYYRVLNVLVPLLSLLLLSFVLMFVRKRKYRS